MKRILASAAVLGLLASPALATTPKAPAPAKTKTVMHSTKTAKPAAKTVKAAAKTTKTTTKKSN